MVPKETEKEEIPKSPTTKLSLLALTRQKLISNVGIAKIIAICINNSKIAFAGINRAVARTATAAGFMRNAHAFDVVAVPAGAGFAVVLGMLRVSTNPNIPPDLTGYRRKVSGGVRQKG